MSGAVLAILESLAYAIAKGVTRAYIDTLREPKKVIEAVANEEDLANRAAFDSAIDGLRSYEPHDSPSQSINSKPTGISPDGGHHSPSP